MSEQSRRLVASTIKGRYALDNPTGPDLTSGQVVEVYLAGEWIAGHIEHSIDGYYFIAYGGGVVGLCLGMQVRLPS